MITCTFEDGSENSLRHVTADCIVIKDGQILLEKRRAGGGEGGKWCLPGGYMERDETTVQGVAREVLEETGWSLANVRLFQIIDHPDRRGEDRQNIDFVYLADANEKVGEGDDESDEVRWFALDELPTYEEMAFDHIDSIILYKKYLAEPFSIPVVG